MKKVLIVEDQRMPRENMERILLDSGKYALSASVNGADVALAVCRQEKIDLILMDVCTAGNKDGIEAAAEIKAEFPDIKIISNHIVMFVSGFFQRFQIIPVLNLILIVKTLQMPYQYVVQLLENIIFRIRLYKFKLVFEQIFYLRRIDIIHEIPNNRPVILFQVIRLALSLKIALYHITIRLTLIF